MYKTEPTTFGAMVVTVNAYGSLSCEALYQIVGEIKSNGLTPRDQLVRANYVDCVHLKRQLYSEGLAPYWSGYYLGIKYETCNLPVNRWHYSCIIKGQRCE